MLFATKHVGGGVQDFDAIKLMKFAVSRRIDVATRLLLFGEAAQAARQNLTPEYRPAPWSFPARRGSCAG